jgi:hypothetical protein
MVGIVFDKLMQYQIVDPTDVVGWTFINGSIVGGVREVGMPLNLSTFEWDLLKGALDKANGRVIIARRKIATLRKEDDDARARAKAKQGMEVDGETKPGMCKLYIRVFKKFLIPLVGVCSLILLLPRSRSLFSFIFSRMKR